MSQYEGDLERLATLLARTAADPVTTSSATDASAVNRARLGVRRWCRAVLDDVAPAQHVYVDREPSLMDLAVRPVGTLRALLDHDPEPFELYAGNRASEQSSEEANEPWWKLLAAAEVVSYGWSASDPGTRPSGDHAWATVADVAAVAEASALVDSDLLATLPGKRDSAYARDCWEVAVAARHVRQLATTGPLPTAPPLRPLPHRQRPVNVRTLSDMAPALASLAALVANAKHLSPEMFGALASTHARTVRTLAKALPATGPTDHRPLRDELAKAINNHADMLGNVQVACRRLRTLDSGDSRPAVQMREIRAGLRTLRARPADVDLRQGQALLLDAVGAALKLGPALTASAHSHISSGRWLQPNASQDYGWEKVSPDAPIAEAVLLVQGQARTLTEQLPQPRPTASPHRSPREVLDRKILHRDRQRAPNPAAKVL